MGMMGIRGGSSDYRRVTYRNTDGSVTGTVSYNISKKNDKKYKKLRYNFKGISKEILRTKTSLSARAVMIRAKGVTAKCGETRGPACTMRKNCAMLSSTHSGWSGLPKRE